MTQAQMRVENGDLRRTIATLANLPKNVRNKAVRIGLNAAGGIIKRDVESKTPIDLGYLKRSYAVKVTQKKSTKDWHLTVGGNRKKQWKARGGTRIGTRVKGKRPIYDKTIKPSRYLHLANNGSKGKPGHHFIEATVASAGIAATAKAIAKINSEILKLAAQVKT